MTERFASESAEMGLGLRRQYSGAGSYAFSGAFGGTLGALSPVLSRFVSLSGAQAATDAAESVATGGREVPKWKWGQNAVPESEAEAAYAAIRVSKTDVEAIARYQGLNQRGVGRL